MNAIIAMYLRSPSFLVEVHARLTSLNTINGESEEKRREAPGHLEVCLIIGCCLCLLELSSASLRSFCCPSVSGEFE